MPDFIPYFKFLATFSHKSPIANFPETCPVGAALTPADTWTNILT
jgi:hypothetical protein